MAVRGEIPAVPGSGPVRWRVPTGIVLAKVAGAVVLGLVAVTSLLLWYDPRRALVAGAAAVGVAGFAGRDLLAPVRLAADPGGITVIRGYAGHARLPWAAVESVRVDERTRYGMRSAYLEIDAGESVHLFTASELGAPLDEVAAALAELRQRGGAHQRQQEQ